MQLRRPPTLAHIGVLERAPWKRYVIGAVIVALYGVSLKLWYETAGEPYAWALQEQKRTLKEKALSTKDKGVSFKSGEQAEESELKIDEEALPSKLLPGAWTCALIFLTISSHILFHLMCHWSISFKAACLFQPTKRIRTGTFVRLTPQANKGKAAICEVEESEVTLKNNFTFQYQVYEVVEPGEDDPELSGDADAYGVRLIRCPVNLKWREYTTSRGLEQEGLIEKAQDKFGTNVFDLPRPTFMQLYKKQLTAPLAIFQFFCTALWMLDTYWKYTAFTLMTVLGFEASTAFQRLKSMATLRGMSTKSFNVHVYRKLQWVEKPIEDLLPGDIMSLVAKRPDKAEEGAQDKGAADQNKYLTVPCDCLILQGSAIVNEATLTGESVPQMKDEVAIAAGGDAQADPFGKHRIHALFSGTSLIQVTPPQKALPSSGSGGTDPAVPRPPDDGIVCYVIRTGFNSSQGELMRMIEFSTEEVAADRIETALQLLFLLCFALAAAGYVLKKGLEDPTRPTYKTLLRCTLIITSVVPPSLPMQMAFAVHTALMSLLKSGIFCTEPFRVPYAGRVSYCFFDKTGTLTSDQMVAIGVVSADGKEPKKGDAKELTPTKEASTMTALVVAGCHSLIEVEGKAIGDPIEVAALNGVEWSYIPSTGTASPGPWRRRELFAASQKELIATLKDDVEADKKEKAELQKKLDETEKQIKHEKQEAKKLQVCIEQRFHFSSELQRMSTICKISSNTGAAASGAYCLTKGSPEAIGKLVSSKPEWYDATYRAMAEKGQRVLALAFKRLDASAAEARAWAQKPRDASESEMTFAGFISFKCETRKDSMLVIKALQDSKHKAVMLTGDAPLTALSVAQEVGICEFPSTEALVLQEKGDTGQLEWVPAITTGVAKRDSQSFDPAGITALRASHDLVMTGRGLELALQSSEAEAVRRQLVAVQILARLSPWQKEQVINAVRKSEQAFALMCGDGGNDVGALKEADVGLALLSGFGNANVGRGENELAKPEDVKDAEDALAEQRKEQAQKAQAMSKKAQEEMARKKRDLMSRQQEWIEEEMEARRKRGEDTGVKGHMVAMSTVVSRLRNEISKEQQQMQKKHGNAFAAGAAKWAGEMDSMEDTPMVQLGDASTAAPFTTRTPSISACVDIIRQGRCTLLSAVQQMEIMMLESMISAYTMSTMSVDGTRPSEAQMMASGTLISVASLAFSFARPVERMHPVRPLSSVFHPAILFSMLGQLVIHLGCMVYIAQLAKEVMGEEALKEIVEFEKERNKKIDSMDEEAFNDWAWFMSVPFKNNLLNTCCWLVETAQQVSVVFVNYKGRPWMKGLLENQPLFLSITLCVVMVAICAWGAIPYLNHTLNLEVVPPELRFQVMGTLFASLVGSFCWDRLMVACFAPQIWQVMKDEARATTFKDFVPILQTCGYIVGGGLFLVAGNPILWGLAFMMYRNYKKGKEAEAQSQAQAAAKPA
mmetsp:Transcript_62322/g.190446  ORF Transcript_62322/g.190446 Transcript_62322/m.190446 type:complete len:1465 (-) Transcript_62322:85-4479(-)